MTTKPQKQPNSSQAKPLKESDLNNSSGIMIDLRPNEHEQQQLDNLANWLERSKEADFIFGGD
jgi:hypothetical protein